MKFRKKPVVIEAEQWFPGVIVDGVELMPKDTLVSFFRDDGIMGVKTLEGWMSVSPGDWIITGVKGEKYPCKSDIFEMTYEQVSE